MLANNDRVYYKTDMSFEEFKKMIADNEWIEIEREPWVSIPNGWSSRPPKASYLTSSIVYVDWDEKNEKMWKEYNEQLNDQISIKDEILSYKPNHRMKWKYKWNYDRIWNEKGYWDEDKDFYHTRYNNEYLKEILYYCKKYKCKKIKK